VYDMINRKVLDLKSVRIFVLDEADEMLSRGFKDQVGHTVPQHYCLFVCVLHGILMCFWFRC